MFELAIMILPVVIVYREYHADHEVKYKGPNDSHKSGQRRCRADRHVHSPAGSASDYHSGTWLSGWPQRVEGDVVQALMIALVVVVIDEGFDLGFEITW